MRIAFISLMSGMPWGGSELLWSKTADLALKKGHDILLSVYKWDKVPAHIEKLKAQGAEIIFRERFNPDTNLFRKVLQHFKNRDYIKNRELSGIKRWNPDHIIISQGETFDISVHHFNIYRLIKELKKSYSLICHSHEQYGFIPGKEIFPRAVEIFQNASAVYFMSKHMHHMTERRLCQKFPNARITWNPVNIVDRKPVSWPENPDIQFAVVGNLGGRKGQDTLMECLSESVWNERKWHLNLYGEGEGESYIRNLIQFYGLEKRVTLRGFVREVSDIWKKNHILLVPSAGEGMPISLIEAMICGRPAVAADVGGISEVLTEGVTGYIADAPSVKSFSTALERAWKSREYWKDMGARASLSISASIDFEPEQAILKYVIENASG